MKLKAELNALKADILQQIITSKRGQRGLIGGLYALVLGTYALIIAQAAGLMHFLQNH